MVVAAICFAATSLAQDCHGSSSHGAMDMTPLTHPPHGGMVKPAGKYYIEMIVDWMLKEDKITLYLLKESGKAVSNEKITGSIQFIATEGTISEVSLKPRGNEAFVVQLESNEPFSCMVALKIKNKTLSVPFRHEGVSSPGTMVYTCSMHPEIAASNPGKCPICGMDLINTSAY